MLCRLLPVCVVLVLASISCASAPRMGGVRVLANVPDAVLYVDEEIQGPVRAYGRHYIRLLPGDHRIMLEHPDYFPEYVDVTVEENMAMAVRVEMRRRPD